MDKNLCNILSIEKPKYNNKALLCNIGGGFMASRKCNSTATKKAQTKRNSRAEASTDNAKSRTTAKKTSRIKNCN